MDFESKLKAVLPPLTDDEHPGAAFKPPGDLKHSYTINGSSKSRKFEVWCVSLADAAAQQILRNLKIFALFFIEGATMDQLEQPEWTIARWKLWLVYELAEYETRVESSWAKRSPYYTLAGFATSYRLYVTPDEDALAALKAQGTEPDYKIDESYFSGSEDSTANFDTVHGQPSRERISQFIILPPWHRQSHGSHLYNTMIDTFLSDSTVFEITVEDPNESFDKLRDVNDLLRLQADPAFNALRLPDSVPADQLTNKSDVPLDLLLPSTSQSADTDTGTTRDLLRHKYKLAPRQFARLLEMHLLSTIPRPNRSPSRILRKSQSSVKEDRHFYFWRLVVKERVYRKNRDELMQMDADERIGKVEDLLPGIQAEYEEVLEQVERMRKTSRMQQKSIGNGAKGQKEHLNGNGVKKTASSVTPVKRRKVISDDEDDDDEDGAGAKRAKV
jgi:histone acetyltransferase 1